VGKKRIKEEGRRTENEGRAKAKEGGVPREKNWGEREGFDEGGSTIQRVMRDRVGET